MANQTYTTPGTDRTTHIDRKDDNIMKRVLPFIVGLIVGWGANEIADNGNHRTTDDARPAQSDR